MLRGKVLILDKDRSTRDSLQFAFIRRGWEVINTVTEEESLAVLSDYTPDWIIASWDQLEKSGSPLVRMLRKCHLSVRLSILTDSVLLFSSVTEEMNPELMFAKPIEADDVYEACTNR